PAPNRSAAAHPQGSADHDDADHDDADHDDGQGRVDDDGYGSDRDDRENQDDRHGHDLHVDVEQPDDRHLHRSDEHRHFPDADDCAYRDDRPVEALRGDGLEHALGDVE